MSQRGVFGMLEERFAALANDHLAASDSPTDASGRPSVTALGTEPIQYMRGFSCTGKLPEALLADMHSR